jgi:hypothetical protein
MRKQVDFDVRVFKLTPSGQEAGTTTRDSMREFLRTNYPFEQGWEVVNTFLATPEQNTVPLAVVLVRYEDVDTESTVKAKAK